MYKILTLLLPLLTCLLVSMQSTEVFAEDKSEEYTYPTHIEYSHIPLSNKVFYITINSPDPRIASIESAYPYIGWYYNRWEIVRKLNLIDVRLNQNEVTADDFKWSVDQKSGAAATSILFNRDGFYCNKEFCEEAGDQQYGMGICTPYYCDCSWEIPKPKRCNKRTEAFDPMYMACAEAFRVKICGF